MKGFTLVELMVVILIVAMLATMGISAFDFIRAKQYSNLAINHIASVAKTTQLLALSYRQTMSLCPSNDNKNCSSDWSQPLIIFYTDENNNTNVVAHYSGIVGGKLRWSGFIGKSLVQYQANGQLLASNGTFIYCPNNQDKTLIRAVIINRVGRMRMAEDLNNDGVVDSKEGQSISCA